LKLEEVQIREDKVEKRYKLIQNMLVYVLYGILTAVVAAYIWSLVEQLLDSVPLVNQASAHFTSTPFSGSIFSAIFLVFVGLIFVGYLSKRFIWDRLADLPIVEGLTSTVGQVSKKLLSGAEESRGRVVWVKWPNEELQTIGIIAGGGTYDPAETEWFSIVLFPTAGSISGGMLRRAKPELVTGADMTIEEALAFVKSSGAIDGSNESSSNAD